MRISGSASEAHATRKSVRAAPDATFPALPRREPLRRATIFVVGELVVVVTVAAIFLVPTALGKGEDAKWPGGDLGRALDWLLIAALAAMTCWVTIVLVREASG